MTYTYAYGMKKLKTLKSLVLSGVLAVCAVLLAAPYMPAQAAVVDYSESYFGGAVPRYAPPPQTAPGYKNIAEIGGGADVGAILGCSGLDISSAIQSTLNMDNIAEEFENYLKSSLAQSALTMLYQSPALNSVLDGLKAVGHARVSIQQQKCDANEAMADANYLRLRADAQAMCQAEQGSAGVVDCTKRENLEQYVQKLLNEENVPEGEAGKWANGCLYNHVCEGEDECAWSTFMPNFCYDVGAGEGRAAPAYIAPQDAFNGAENQAGTVLDGRMEVADTLLSVCGYTDALQIVSAANSETGQIDQSIAPDCYDIVGNAMESDSGSSGATGSSSGPDSAPTPPSTLGDATDLTSEEVANLASYKDFFSREACVDPENAASVYTDVKRILDEASEPQEDENGEPIVGGALDMSGFQDIINGVVKCMLKQEIHPHVDINMAMLPPAQREGMKKSLSQAIAAKATINVFNAIIFKMSELMATKGFDSKNSMNGPVREFVVQQIDQMKNMRDAMRHTLDSYKDISERVSAMNTYINQSESTMRDRIQRNAANALSSLNQ